MMLTRATFYVLITLGNIVIGIRQQCAERDEVAARRRCGQACLPDGTCKKQNRECVCNGLCGLTCLTKKCPPLTTPHNGSLEINPNGRTTGAEATYACNIGYVISGIRNRTCQTNKTWSGTKPTCTQATTEGQFCPSGRCIVPNIENGFYSNSPGGAALVNGSCTTQIYLYVVCNDGMQLDGSHFYYCREGELYTTNNDNLFSRCIRGCSNGCQVPHLENGYFTQSTFHRGKRLLPLTCVSSGRHVYIICHPGLHLLGSYYYTCQSRGEWLKPYGVDSTCQFCPSGRCIVPYIENGFYSNSPGGVALVNGSCTTQIYLYVVCNDGMQLDGSYFYYCREGELYTTNNDNLFSRCTRAHCSVATNDNGSVTRSNGDSFTLEASHGDWVRFSCEQGYTLAGEEISHCHAGEWIPEIPSCVEVPFDHDALGNGDVTYTVDEQGRAFCVRIDDDEPFVCDTGTWTLELPTKIPPLPSFTCYKTTTPSFTLVTPMDDTA